MKKLALLSAFLALPLAAQVTIANGLVYQAAAQNGIAYINPTEGAAVLNQKAGVNVKTIISSIVSSATIGIATAGVGNSVISMSKPWVEGLLAAHFTWDGFGPKLLATAAPNPQSVISMLLPIGGVTSFAGGACSDSYMLISNPSKKTTSAPKSTVVGGVAVIFSPQGIAVLVNASGSKVKGLAVIDALMCPLSPGTVVAPAIENTLTPTAKLEPCGDARHPCLKLQDAIEDAPVLTDFVGHVSDLVGHAALPIGGMYVGTPQWSDDVGSNKFAPIASCVGACPTLDSGSSASREHDAAPVANNSAARSSERAEVPVYREGA